MNDESFHLTPLDVRRYDFGKKAIGGYDPERVEQFRDQVVEELERLARLNQDLEGKARNFHEQLRAFRERDKAINDALVSAQQLRGEIREQADREAELALREARAEADRITDEANSRLRAIESQITALDRMRRGFLAQMRVFAERQLAEIDASDKMPSPDASAVTGAHAQAAAPAAAAPRAQAERLTKE